MCRLQQIDDGYRYFYLKNLFYANTCEIVAIASKTSSVEGHYIWNLCIKSYYTKMQ